MQYSCSSCGLKVTNNKVCNISCNKDRYIILQGDKSLQDGSEGWWVGVGCKMSKITSWLLSTLCREIREKIQT